MDAPTIHSRQELKTLLRRYSIAAKLPRFGRVLIVSHPNGSAWRIEKAFGTDSPARPTDTFVLTTL